LANIESLPQFKSSDSLGDNRDRISAVETEVFDLLVPNHKASAIQPENFGSRYPVYEIKRDLAAVEEKKSQFSGENPERNKRADILEAILAEQAELSDWLGKDALTITASEYDNFFYGIDIAVEFEKGDEFKYLALSMDITSSAKAVEGKLGKIKEGILTGKLTKMKYFTSERNPSPAFPGPLEQLPNVVIGIDQRTIAELAELRLQIFKAREMKNKEKDPSTQDLYTVEIKTAKDKLARHRVQILILKELEMQLEVFANFAAELGQTDASQKYRELLKFVWDILETKHISKDAERINATDDVYRAIEKSLDKFRSL